MRGSSGSPARNAAALAKEASESTTTAQPYPASAKLEFPQRVLAQPRLLHLAARGHADRLEVRHDLQVARHAEIGAALLYPRQQLLLAYRLMGLQSHIRARHLAQARVGHAD